MRRVIFIALSLIVCMVAACSRETPGPSPTQTSAPPSPTPVVTSTGVAPSTSSPAIDKGTYDNAMTWMKSNPGFRFTLVDHGVNAVGTMTRKTVASEVVTLRVDGAEWRCEAGPRGLVWSKREGSGWKETTPPDYAGRLFQRVTVAFDPQKKEGSAQLASSDATSNVYRFTNANSGEVHELRVNKADAHIESMKVGDAVMLTITP